MNIKEQLIEALEEKRDHFYKSSELIDIVKGNLMDDVIELCNEHLEGKVIAPLGFVGVAECAIPDCIDGAYYDTYGEAAQCQFCHEKKTMLKAYKEQS